MLICTKKHSLYNSCRQLFNTLFAPSYTKELRQESTQLANFWQHNPQSRSEVIQQLRNLRSESSFHELTLKVMYSGLDKQAQVDSLINSNANLSGLDFDSHYNSALNTSSSGRADHCIFHLTQLLHLSSSTHELLLASRMCVFLLNKFGYHYYAQQLALVNYEISQKLGYESTIQRSKFSVFYSTCLTGDAVLKNDFQNEAIAAYNGNRCYSESNQSLTFPYVASFLMDQKARAETVQKMLHFSDDFCATRYSRQHNLLNWARLHHLEGRRLRAQDKLNELNQTCVFSLVDKPFFDKLKPLSKKLKINTHNLTPPPIVHPKRAQLYQLDCDTHAFLNKVKSRNCC